MVGKEAKIPINYTGGREKSRKEISSKEQKRGEWESKLGNWEEGGRKFRQKNKKNWEEGGSRNLGTRCMGGRRGGGLMLQVMFEDFCSVARVTPCKVPQIKGQSACRGIKTVLSLISF